MIIKSRLLRMIDEGEHQTQDFKFAISDSKKIARSLAAFANTDGGRLLIGVKDNGAIAGVRSDEEFYMIEAAANMYCKPEITFEVEEFKYKGKSVLQINIAESEYKLHKAPDKDGNYKVYTRVHDQNLLVNVVYIKAMKQRYQERNVLKVSKPVEQLMAYLDKNEEVTLSGFCRLAKIRRNVAIHILAQLVSLDILNIKFTEKTVSYVSANMPAEQSGLVG